MQSEDMRLDTIASARGTSIRSTDISAKILYLLSLYCVEIDYSQELTLFKESNGVAIDNDVYFT
jgi:hypothetical protein